MKVEPLPPTPEEFQALRTSCGWGKIDTDIARTALENSIIVFTLRDDSGLIGVVRLVGDGALNIYIQDLIVRHDVRNRGHARSLMEAALQWARRNASRADIGLMAAEGLEDMYQAMGFELRPASGFGAGMMLYAE